MPCRGEGNDVCASFPCFCYLCAIRHLLELSKVADQMEKVVQPVKSKLLIARISRIEYLKIDLVIQESQRVPGRVLSVQSRSHRSKLSAH